MTSEAHEPPARYLVKAEYRRTEIGVIPTDWDVKRLRDISPNQSVGLVINPSTYFDTKGTVPMLVGSNVAENRIDWNGARRISTASNERLPASRIYAGDLVTVRVGDPGVTAVIPREYSGSNCASMMIVRSHPSFDSTWLCHLMNSSYGRSRIESVQYGTAQKQFNISDAVDFQYPVPPLAEQRAIATALSNVDALIAGLERLIAKKRDIKQAAMQQLLTGQTRLPGFSEEWSTETLGNLAEIQRGASPRPIDSPVWFDTNSSVGWVRISDVTSSGMYLNETTQRLSQQGIKHSRPVERGSLIMSICATVGRPVITAIDVCIHDGFVVFDSPRADKHFLYHVLQWIEPAWAKHGQTGSQMNLNTGLIRNTPVPCPALEEQIAIASALSGMDTDLSALESRLAKTRAIKQGMMQELLTGRTRLV
ncbi:type I restriction enzyme S subunit [Sphaerotilus hippei]|uniref:Type I restriction enzyme S subunit n=1 Tax=Sphaerotilus hippei TaxID=744406 RepID=A0A318GVG3_9BURK|nr:restriction endonuclease subunit S [Sphaerotilus hippei]PXW91895.1 type I restriction enzyme S subunit [Sphaerotilus hippei]